MRDVTDLSIGEALAELCESTALWRESLIERFPNDWRNHAAAEELCEFAVYVRDLPDSRFGELTDYFDGERFPGTDITRSLVSRFGGYSSGMRDVEEFLDELVSAAVEEEIEFWQELEAQEASKCWCESPTPFPGCS